MAFVEPVVLRERGVRLEPLALEHEAGLAAAAARPALVVAPLTRSIAYSVAVFRGRMPAAS